ncbi:unnamed protein product [Pleuronectes platessa]|uniref:Uncharacterized protein n=1 Tax=Pleuronectes platessa TaxID=8262 RepID=A0A9N7V5R4_PLEPL|nr:unnamed protein product [Pleuronectes platessa]
MCQGPWRRLSSAHRERRKRRRKRKTILPFPRPGSGSKLRGREREIKECHKQSVFLTERKTSDVRPSETCNKCFLISTLCQLVSAATSLQLSLSDGVVSCCSLTSSISARLFFNSFSLAVSSSGQSMLALGLKERTDEVNTARSPSHEVPGLAPPCHDS